MKQNISPAVAALIIVVILALVGGVFYWRDQKRMDASAMKPNTMLPPQFRSMSTKDPVPPASATTAQPQGGNTLMPPGIGGGGPAIQSGGMTPGGMAPTPGGMPPSPPGMAPGAPVIQSGGR
ncbi:MAG: hypothetical protein FJX72_16640 [Armatimonadetes bacterium]|nr:hypothetical protein [Armatimonadota bacterium]